jgi:hypothetical protein
MSTTAVILKTLKERGIDDCANVNTRSLRLINAAFRAVDDSHLFPINGEFNATERAIRWYRRVYFTANGPCSNYEYILGLENVISRYVNGVNY